MLEETNQLSHGDESFLQLVADNTFVYRNTAFCLFNCNRFKVDFT
jgi:hypothetical protein